MTSSAIQNDIVPSAKSNGKEPIFLWATPRSVSTAFERVMKNSDELFICHEPYTEAYYFGSERKSNRYGNIDKLKGNSEEYSPKKINQRIIEYSHENRLFIKELAFQAENYISNEVLFLVNNIFIISNPIRVYSSLIRLKPDFTEEEFGFLSIKNIYDRVMSFQKETIVIDGNNFRNSPKKTLEFVSKFINIRYSDDLLNWESGQIREWKTEEAESQLKYHSTLENSKGILPSMEQEILIIKPEHVAIVRRAEKIYDELIN